MSERVSGKSSLKVAVILREPKRLEESRAGHERCGHSTGSFDSFHSLKMTHEKNFPDTL